MFISKKDITVVVQGPDHENTPAILANIDRQGFRYIRGLSNEAPALTTYNQQNIARQCYSTIVGLEQVETDYVFKCRADIFLEDFDPFLLAINTYPERYICSNLHFRPDRTFKFHASDKFIMAKTADLLNTFELAKTRCNYDSILLQSGIYEQHNIAEKLYRWVQHTDPRFTTPEQTPLIGALCLLPWGYIGVYPEVLLTTSWLMNKGISIERDKSQEIMKKNFAIVQVERCGKYINKLGSRVPEHNWQEAHDIAQI